MQQLVALSSFTYPYRGKSRRPGELFQAADSHAKVLVAIKKARVATAADLPEGRRRGRQPRPQWQRPQAVAKETSGQTAAAPPPAAPAEDAAGEQPREASSVHVSPVTAALRERLRSLSGEEPPEDLTDDQLREQISTARSARYARRDMRPQE